MAQHLPRVSDLVRDSQLTTKFFTDGATQHAINSVSVQSGRRRRVRVEETWGRQRRLGSGTFGSVWLESCTAGPSTGKFRAVKESNLRIFIAMEYLQYGDLQKYMDHPFPESQVKDVASQLLEGLGYMHDNGFTHGDLKPAWVKIADFGITKRAEQDSTALRTFIGTQGYLAPEVIGFIVGQSSQSSNYTSAIDIRALGELLFRMLSNRPRVSIEARLVQLCCPQARIPCVDIGRAVPKSRFTSKGASAHPWIKTLLEEPDSDSGTSQGWDSLSDPSTLDSEAPFESNAQWSTALWSTALWSTAKLTTRTSRLGRGSDEQALGEPRPFSPSDGRSSNQGTMIPPQVTNPPQVVIQATRQQGSGSRNRVPAHTSAGSWQPKPELVDEPVEPWQSIPQPMDQPVGRVFGRSLAQFYERDAKPVPDIVFQCIQTIEFQSLSIENIYGLSTVSFQESKDIEKLKTLFDTSEKTDVQVDAQRLVRTGFSSITPNTVIGLLKLFLRQLPDPLLTRKQHDDFISAAKYEDAILRRDFLHTHTNDLPDPHYAVFRSLILHLSRIKDQNGTASHRFALAFGPIVMGGHDGKLADMAWEVKVLDAILQHTYDIFDED
ncbi:kinase-like domain-containing protein [Dactylonectria macrodidyma]|uniref:Kinase-like domain-containing protein n=1 Tax=Dactylonectria macrodidyma TaxID=307937 RepID=A0A9P9IMI3_9HYPO|nr:kinase-like domain-containing protein [Dactylonectria macrodidyma]